MTAIRLFAAAVIAATVQGCMAPGAQEAPASLAELSLRQRLDAAVPALLSREKVASVSIAHISNGEIDLLAAYGEQAPGVRATEDTLYNIASLSKPLATEVYLRFASQSGLSIDTPMADVWTDPDLTGDSRTRRLTPRHVLSHRTGFPNWRYQTGGVLKFKTDPGDRFGYSGEGFEYLHAYLDRVSGQPLNELARSLVLDPAGMRDTYFGWPASQRARVARPSVRGKWLESDTSPDVLAADNVHTTARDYAKFVVSMFDEGSMAPVLRGEQVRIQTDRKADLCKHIDAPYCPQEAGFGLGWESYLFETTRVLMHTGNDSGEAAIVIVDLQRRDAFILLSNSKNGLSVAKGLLDVLGLEPGLVEYLKRA